MNFLNMKKKEIKCLSKLVMERKRFVQNANKVKSLVLEITFTSAIIQNVEFFGLFTYL